MVTPPTSVTTILFTTKSNRLELFIEVIIILA